jgi:acetoin utilization protein AcuB
MRVKDIMTNNPVTVEPDTPLRDAHRLMVKHKIRKLPVLKRGKLVGMLTYDMVLEASPSPATSLSMQELHYLLAEMKVREIMAKDPETLGPDTEFEKALLLCQNSRIRRFPVVDKGKLVGITTHGNILRLLTRTLRLHEEGVRLTIEGLGGHLGELKDIISIFDRHQALVMSIMTLSQEGGKDWSVVIRLKIRDVTAAVHDLRKAGLQVNYAP